MSVGNYYVVRRHPEGGYFIAQGSVSDGDDRNGDKLFLDLEVEDSYPRYKNLAEARSEATSLYAEHGSHIHPECEAPPK
jgi:hypothetical protein